MCQVVGYWIYILLPLQSQLSPPLLQPPSLLHYACCILNCYSLTILGLPAFINFSNVGMRV